MALLNLKNIANAVKNNEQDVVIQVVSELIYQAWTSWDESLTRPYHTGEKPDQPTAAFITAWVEEEDFDADFSEEQVEYLYINY